MLNWIVGFCHKTAEIHVLGRTRLTPSGYQTQASAVGARCHNHHATACCYVTNFNVYLNLLPQPKADPGHIALPSRCTRHFSLPITPWDSAESIYMIPTIGSSPSLFLRFLAIQFPPWPKTHFTCLWLNKKAVPRPCYHLTITQSNSFGSSIYPKPDLAHVRTQHPHSLQ